MIFNTVEYFILFLIPAAILFRVVRPTARPWICFVFGAGFFVFFSLAQVGGAPGAFCLFIFIWESLFSRLYKKGSWLCIAGIVQTLIFLIIFKYWNFFTGLLFTSSGKNPLYWTGAFLPLGISFFTFEFIHYAVDRYRGTTHAGTFTEYLTFIMFFPTMVAGPIKRYQDFLPKLRHPSRDWKLDWTQGGTRILAGLAKKFAVADLLTAFTNHLNYVDIAQAQRWVLPVWLLAYGMKIYFDFSAYSDIAIGSAQLFGIKVPENFDWPYLRTNIAEFWKHWHMSLYRWLVDYVFIPLGGSRTTPSRVYLNVMLTMLISGLWHGAALNFVVWGLWHGMLLCVHRLWSSWRADNAPLSLAGAVQVIKESAAATRLAWNRAKLEPVTIAAGSNPDAHTAEAGLLLSQMRTPESPVENMSRKSSQSKAEPSELTERKRVQGFTWGKIGSWGLTFASVNLGWAFFCMDLHTSLFFLKRLILG
jgi:alginate O-acetyltransferase complex protein AlgI